MSDGPWEKWEAAHEAVGKRRGSEVEPVAPEPLCMSVTAERVEHWEAMRSAAEELCVALAERWFAPGDVEAQTARCVAAHRRLSDILMHD